MFPQKFALPLLKIWFGYGPVLYTMYKKITIFNSKYYCLTETRHEIRSIEDAAVSKCGTKDLLKKYVLARCIKRLKTPGLKIYIVDILGEWYLCICWNLRGKCTHSFSQKVPSLTTVRHDDLQEMVSTINDNLLSHWSYKIAMMSDLQLFYFTQIILPLKTLLKDNAT